MKHLELTRVMYVAGLIRTRRTLGTKISLKKLYKKLKRTVQVSRIRKRRRQKKHVQSSDFEK
jgi:uncharacterized iron-regulated protein